MLPYWQSPLATDTETPTNIHAVKRLTGVTTLAVAIGPLSPSGQSTFHGCALDDVLYSIDDEFTMLINGVLTHRPGVVFSMQPVVGMGSALGEGCRWRRVGGSGANYTYGLRGIPPVSRGGAAGSLLHILMEPIVSRAQDPGRRACLSLPTDHPAHTGCVVFSILLSVR